MSSQSSGRRRSNMRQYSAEDQALNVISKEAEARLAAKRAARAEAREIRMKEIEKQEKESEGKQDRVHEIANEHSSSKSRQMSGSRSGSRRGSTESNDSDAKDVDFKAELRELEEKYKAAMMTSAQLDNEKQSLVYQVELLKDQLEEQDEGYTELQREHKDKCREYEFMKRDLKTMEHELNILKQQLEIKDKLIMESGFVILANDKGEPVLEKQSTNNGPLPSGAVLVSAETKDFLEKAEGVTLGTSVSDCTSSASPSPVVSTSSVDALDSVENKIEGSEWGNKSGNVDMVQLESSRDRASIETVHVCSSLSTKFNEPNDNSKQSECNINLKDSFDGTMSETNEGRVNLITKKHSNELSTLNIPKDTSIVSGEDSDECDEFFDAISTPSPLKKTVQEQESCGSSVDPDDTQQHASAQATFEDGSCVDLVAETHLNIQDKSIDKEAVGENEYQSSINNGNNSFTSEVNDKPLAHESEDNCLKQSDDLVINILNTSEVNADVNKISFEKNKVYSMDITEVDMNKSEKNEVNVEQVVSDVQDNDKKEDLGKSSDEIIYDNREVEQDKFRISEVIDASDQEEEVSMGDNVESLALNVTVEQCDLNSDNQVTAIGSCLEDIKKDTLIKEIDASSNITEVKEKDSIKADEEIVNQNEEIKIENVIKDTDQTASVITEVKQDDLIKANQEVDSQKEDVKMEDINKNSLSDISDIKPDDLTKADEVTVIDSGNEDVRSVKDDDLIKIYQDNFFDNQNVNIIKDTDQTVSDENADQEGAKVTENADQEGAKVTENADQEGAKVTENADQEGAKVTENADQEGAKVTENADQEGAKVTENVDQECAKVTENDDQECAKVTENVDQEGAKVTENADQECAKVTENADQEGAKVTENADQEGAKVTENVDQECAKVTENADQEGAKVTENADQEGAKVTENADQEGAKVTENADQEGAKVTENADQEGAKVTENADQEGAKVTENDDQEGAKVTENADQEGAKVTENADQEGAKVTENANTKTEDVTEVDLIKVYQDTVVDNQNTKIITDSNPTVTDDLIKADQEISNLNEKVNAKKKDVKEDNLIKTNVENQNEAVKIDNFIKDSDLTESGITEDKQDNLIKSHQEAVTVNQNENIKKEDLIIDSDPSLSIHNEDNDIKAYQENLVENEDGNVKRGDLINQTKQTVSNVTEVEQGDSSTEVDETTLYNSDKSAKLNETQCSTIQDNVESIGHNKVQDFKKDDLITNSEQIISPDTNENVISKVEDKLQDMNENEEVNMVDNKLTASDSTTGELASETQSDVQEDLKTNNGEDISSIQEECVLCLENVNSSISETVSVENPSLTSDVDGQGNVDTFHNTPSDNVPDRLDDVIGKSQILQKSLSVEGSEGEGLEGYDLDDIDDILQSSDKNQELKVNDILRDDKAKDEPHSETSSLKEIITSHKSVSESPTSSGHKKDKSLKSKLSIRKGKKEKHELSVTKGEKLDKAESHSSLEPENLESTLDKHLAEPGLSMTHKKSKKFSLFKKVFK